MGPRPQRPAGGTVLRGAYTLGDVLSVGTIAILYRGHRTEDPRVEVAVRVLRPEAQGRFPGFAGEGALLRDLEQACIVKPIDAGIDDGTPAVVYPLLKGKSLDRVLLENKAGLGLEEVARIVQRIAAVLAYVHGRPSPVVHGALRPSKIFLADPRRGVRVLGVGFAQVMENVLSKPEQRWEVLSPAYTAPEHVRGTPPLSPPMDVFSLAAIAFEALTNARAFQAKDVAQAIALFARGAPASASALRRDVRRQVDAVLSAAWDEDPEKRPTPLQFAEDFVNALGVARPIQHDDDEDVDTAVIDTAITAHGVDLDEKLLEEKWAEETRREPELAEQSIVGIKESGPPPALAAHPTTSREKVPRLPTLPFGIPVGELSPLVDDPSTVRRLQTSEPLVEAAVRDQPTTLQTPSWDGPIPQLSQPAVKGPTAIPPPSAPGQPRSTLAVANTQSSPRGVAPATSADATGKSKYRSEPEPEEETLRVVNVTGVIVSVVLGAAIVVGAALVGGAMLVAKNASNGAPVATASASATAKATTSAEPTTSASAIGSAAGSASASASASASGAVAPSTSSSSSAPPPSGDSDWPELPKEKGARPSKLAVDAFVAKLKPQLEACAHGMTKAFYTMKLEVDPLTGRVVTADVIKPLRGSVQGACAMSAALAARMPAFAGPVFAAEIKFIPK
jgi:serine/threonine protein kinase